MWESLIKKMKTKIMTNNYKVYFKAFGMLGLTSIILTAPTYSQNLNSVQSVSTTPMGLVRLDIAPGTGVGGTKRPSLISLPLLSTDSSIPNQGIVNAVKSQRTLEVSATNKGDDGSSSFPAGYLSNPQSPFVLMITSGQAKGIMYLIDTSTPNTQGEITLTDPHNLNLDLAQESIAPGDSFRIYPCDTLLSFFGTPETTGILGGVSPNTSDTILLVSNGSAQTYYFNTNLNRWARVGLGSPDASNIPLLPYYGIQYMRLSASPLELFTFGEVPTSSRKVKLRTKGITLLSSFYPIDWNLANFGLHNNQNWSKAPSSTLADTVVLSANGSVSTYFHNGSNWRRVGLGSPVAELTPIPGASAILINKKDTSSGITIFEQELPYSL